MRLHSRFRAISRIKRNRRNVLKLELAENKETYSFLHNITTETILLWRSASIWSQSSDISNTLSFNLIVCQTTICCISLTMQRKFMRSAELIQYYDVEHQSELNYSQTYVKIFMKPVDYRILRRWIFYDILIFIRFTNVYTLLKI